MSSPTKEQLLDAYAQLREAGFDPEAISKAMSAHGLSVVIDANPPRVTARAQLDRPKSDQQWFQKQLSCDNEAPRSMRSSTRTGCGLSMAHPADVSLTVGDYDRARLGSSSSYQAPCGGAASGNLLVQTRRCSLYRLYPNHRVVLQVRIDHQPDLEKQPGLGWIGQHASDIFSTQSVYRIDQAVGVPGRA